MFLAYSPLHNSLTTHSETHTTFTMRPLLSFNVTPRLPSALEPLRELAFNLWWSWEPEVRKLFRDIDEKMWRDTNHSPVRMLQLARQSRLEQLSEDDDYLRTLHAAHARFQAYMNREDTYAHTRSHGTPLEMALHGEALQKGGEQATGPVAYFSAEFGFHESVPIYSGGLGILSGDHCKSASDLGLNFVAVTLLYRHGYFKQQINHDGMQEAMQLDQNFHHLPIEEVAKDGEEIKVSIELADDLVTAKVWQMKVGRITLYLLDTDILENSPQLRQTTAQLYGGDREMRIRQELILGVGGVRALHAMGIEPQVYHMNEGHSAFLSLERIRRYMESDGVDFATAAQVVSSSNVFTTHTPVAAGNDSFSKGLTERYIGHFARAANISFGSLYAYGLASPAAPDDEFSMTILALSTSRHANGVSKLHGSVSRGMWADVWKGVPTDEVPITSITNGIHTKTWLAPEFDALYRKYLGEDWEDRLTDTEFWRRVMDVPAEELWNTHQLLKERLVHFVRSRILAQRQRHGEPPESLRKVSQVLEPQILTIGFARRFATYKRAVLLFSDPERLNAIVNNPERPVQFIFAGKAHPADEEGKNFIRGVVEISRQPEFEERIVFLEDYDAHIGRRLYQGVDLWLNNPLRPMEASGTSGMKLPPNGGLNFSVLDGWWPEAYNKNNGWTIGEDITDGDPTFQNQVDSGSLYHTLENQVVPLFYAKPDGLLPLAWIQLMRESIRTITPAFNTHRMVKEYNEKLYEHAARAYANLRADSCARARELSTWKAKIRDVWPRIKVNGADVDVEDRFHVTVDQPVKITSTVFLDGISPEDVRVQAYAGDSDDNDIHSPTVTDLELTGPGDEAGTYLYEGTLGTPESGSYGVNVRIIPHSPLLTQDHELRLIRWATP